MRTVTSDNPFQTEAFQGAQQWYSYQHISPDPWLAAIIIVLAVVTGYLLLSRK